MKRLQYMLTRIVQGLLLLIATVNFLLVRAAPGDPVSVLAGEAGASDAQFVAQLRREFGLDQPLSTQLGSYLGHVATLDLGWSYRQQQPVLKLITDRLPATCCSPAAPSRCRCCSAWRWAPWPAGAWAAGSTAPSPWWPWCSSPRRCTGWR
jgi:peptide/nickel transport system permease protein